MFEGSEGPERAAGGRYEQRQTRQVLSAFFCHFFAQSCAAAPTWQQRIDGDRRCRWAAPFIPGHIVQLRTAGRADSGRVEPRTLKVANWPTPGPSPRLGHTRDADVVQHGMALRPERP